jgi:hypothetical protein
MEKGGGKEFGLGGMRMLASFSIKSKLKSINKNVGV